MKAQTWRYIVSAIIIFLLANCSTSNIATRGEYIEQNSFSKDLPRIDILARFGKPIETSVNKDGKKIDLFRVRQGEKTSGKVIKGLGTAILAVGTFGFSEIVASPVTENTPMVVFEVLYDKNERVESVNFIQSKIASSKVTTYATDSKKINSFKEIDELLNVRWRVPQKTRMLLVGIGNYQDNTIPEITYAKSDAHHFFSFAQSSDIPKENLNCLTNEQATRSEITGSLINLKMATTKKSETAIFYFSGHGAPIVEDGRIVDAVIVPYDARENSLEYTGIKVSTLRELLSNVRGNWVVILDACFSGKEGRSLMVKNVKAITVVPKDFSVVPKSGENTWWLTATSGDNFANDFPKENSGLFTHYLLKALNGEKGVDENDDGLITMREAFNWTKKEVQDVSAKALGRLQVPEMIGEGDTILTIPR